MSAEVGTLMLIGAVVLVIVLMFPLTYIAGSLARIGDILNEILIELQGRPR